MSTAAEYPTIADLGDRIGGLIERQFETICRALVQGPNAVNEPGFFRFVTGEMHPLGNFAVVSDPSDPEVTRVAIEPLCSGGAPTAVVFSGPVCAAVETLVLARGFALAETMPAMAVDLDEVVRPPLPRGCGFREIHAGADDAPWCDALAIGYGLPRPVAEAFGPDAASRMTVDAVARYFALTRDGVMVATCTLFLEGGLAGIYCVSTIPPERGKGLGASVTAEPLRVARDLGYRTGVLQSSAMGESVYRRLGFGVFGSMPLYVRMPGPAAALS